MIDLAIRFDRKGKDHLSLIDLLHKTDLCAHSGGLAYKKHMSTSTTREGFLCPPSTLFREWQVIGQPNS